MANKKLQRMGQGYAIALKHYQEQKANFLQALEIMQLQEYNEASSQLFSNVSTSEEGQRLVNDLINEINNIISSDQGVSEVRKRIAHAYQVGQLTKEHAIMAAQNELQQIFDPLWLRAHVLSKLGTLGMTQIASIDDNALLGKVHMLLGMALRHEGPLNPSNWTRKQVEGILYEHAVVDGFQQYFNSIPNISKLISVTGVGAQGGRGDIEFVFSQDVLNKVITGSTKINMDSFQMQIKNMDLQAFISSQDHSLKLKVGNSVELLNEALAEGYSTPLLSMYFLSKDRNVIRAIGEKVSLYGYANGQFMFTADLIQTLHYKHRCSLGFPGIKRKQASAYIYWMKQKN